MIALDTNVIARLLLEDDEEQVARAKNLLARCIEQEETCLLTIAVLCELEWVLTSVYKAKRQDVGSAIQGLLTDPIYEFEDRSVVRKALDQYLEGKGDLSDYLIGAKAHALSAATTFTFDKALKDTPGFTLL